MNATGQALAPEKHIERPVGATEKADAAAAAPRNATAWKSMARELVLDLDAGRRRVLKPVKSSAFPRSDFSRFENTVQEV